MMVKPWVKYLYDFYNLYFNLIELVWTWTLYNRNRLPNTSKNTQFSRTVNPPILRVPISRVSTNHRQPIVFRCCYRRIWFRPITVFELRWVMDCFPCMNDYLPLRALCCSPCTAFNEPKCKVMENVNCAQRQRKIMTLGEKLELLDRLARGENAASVGCHYGVNDCRLNLPHCTLPRS